MQHGDMLCGGRESILQYGMSCMYVDLFCTLDATPSSTTLSIWLNHLDDALNAGHYSDTSDASSPAVAASKARLQTIAVCVWYPSNRWRHAHTTQLHSICSKTRLDRKLNCKGKKNLVRASHREFKYLIRLNKRRDLVPSKTGFTVDVLINLHLNVREHFCECCLYADKRFHNIAPQRFYEHVVQMAFRKFRFITKIANRDSVCTCFVLCCCWVQNVHRCGNYVCSHLQSKTTTTLHQSLILCITVWSMIAQRMWTRTNKRTHARDGLACVYDYILNYECVFQCMRRKRYANRRTGRCTTSKTWNLYAYGSCTGRYENMLEV